MKNKNNSLVLRKARVKASTVIMNSIKTFNFAHSHLLTTPISLYVIFNQRDQVIKTHKKEQKCKFRKCFLNNCFQSNESHQLFSQIRI